MADTASLLRELAEPRPGGELVKVAIDRAAKRAGLAFWRAFDIWYGKARRVEDFERDQITAALRIKNERAARNELHDIKLRIAKLEARLSASSDPDFHSGDIDFARELLRRCGGAGRAVAGK